MSETVQMRTWAEVSLDNLAHNYRTLRDMLPEGCRFLGLVKANAYGHGIGQIGRKLQKLGCDMLAVACLDEAMELRRVGVTAPILCLGQTPPQFAHLLLECDVIQTISDFETGRAMSDAARAMGKNLKVHIKLDTGMTRLGFWWQEGEHDKSLEEITVLCRLPGLEIEGLFTHFADAATGEEYTMEQFSRFQQARNALEERGITFKICHCAASGAVLNYPCTYLDMVRPGILLYGYYPDATLVKKRVPELLPVLTLKSRISVVREVPAGTPVSYGCSVRLERDSRLAVLPIGYGDGFSRQFSNQMQVLIHRQRCPVVGRVCMDMCMVDVTDLPQVHAGDVAVIYGRGGLLEEGAELAGTIPYELLCNVNPRVPRVYLDSGR